MPKLPPPPRRPQSSSGFSSSLACTSCPSAVTTSAAIRLSQVRPTLRISQPMPPPSVNPAIPVVDTSPPVTASPNACVSWSKSAQVQPPSATGGATRRVDAHRGHGGQVDDDAAVAGGEAGQRVPAAADGDEQVLAARELDRAHDVGDAGAADDQRRPPVVGAVPDRARLVVALVGGPDELAAQALLELGERRVAEHVGGGRFCGHVFELLVRRNSSNALNPAGPDLATP